MDMYSEHGFDALIRPVFGSVCHEVGICGRGGAQVLRVVEEQQELLRAERLRDRVERVLVGFDAHLERVRDRGKHERVVAKRGQLDQHDAIGVRARNLTGKLESEPRLPAPAGARQHDQPRLAAFQQVPKHRELAFSSDERVR